MVPGPETKAYNELEDAFPNLSSEELAAALMLLKERAKTLDMDFSEYLESYHPRGLAFRDEELPEDYKGYVDFLGAGAKAVIHAGKNGDFSTFVHECAHVFRRQLAGPLLEKAERAFGIEGHSWTEEQEEAFALGLEEYIRTREEEEKGKREVFEKGKRFVQNVYAGVDRITTLSPEMKGVYDELFADPQYVFNQKNLTESLESIYRGG